MKHFKWNDIPAERLKTFDLGAGEMLFIPPKVPHTLTALENMESYDIFTPPRHDWLAGEDSYLRK